MGKKERIIRPESEQHSDVIDIGTSEVKRYFVNDVIKKDDQHKTADENPSKSAKNSKNDRFQQQQTEIVDHQGGNKTNNRTEIEARVNLRPNCVSAERLARHQNILKDIKRELNGNTSDKNRVKTDEAPIVDDFCVLNAQQIVDRVNNNSEQKWHAEIFPHSNEMGFDDILRYAGW